MPSRSWRALWLGALVGTAAFLLGSLVIAHLLTGSLRLSGAIALSGAVSFGIVYVIVQLRSRWHQGK